MPEPDDKLSTQAWYWRIGLSFSRQLKKVAPPGSPGYRLYRSVTWPVRGSLLYGARGMLKASLSSLAETHIGKRLVSFLKRLLPQSFKDFVGQFRKELRLPDHSRVILFADDSVLPDYHPRQSLTLPPEARPVQVTLIATIRNEAANIESWLASLLKQSRLPDEIVITDGGSTDGSIKLILHQADTFPVPLRVIEAPGANISRGRNIAIQHASYEVIACADFGCTLGEGWLHNLILPFEADERIEVSCGFFQPTPGKEFGLLASRYLIPSLDMIKPQEFLPSSRSLAFRKQVWERVGGYPEWLSDAGEDTLFDLYAKLHEGWWAFVPQAMVSWHAPNNLSKLYHTQYRYAQGDGEAGLFAPRYWGMLESLAWRAITTLLMLGMLLAVVILVGWLGRPWLAAGLFGAALLVFLTRWIRSMAKYGYKLHRMLMPVVVGLAQVNGFRAGVRGRPFVTTRRAQVYAQQLDQILAEHPNRKGVIVYPPTHDWGYMFQLPQQMARTFARRGFLYFYCTNNEITDDVIGFRQVEPNLYVSYVPLETFSSLQQPMVYIGSPWHCSTLSIFNQPTVIYDYYDDLQVSSGRVADFDALVKRADVVIVTAQRLLDDVKGKRSDALFVPNGVDVAYIESRRLDEAQPAPADWQPIASRGRPIIGYSGSLAERFDYELLRYLVENRPDLEFVLIGASYDSSLERSQVLQAGYPNLHWLGMKPYSELFQYLWRFDVGIIPFKINEITQATTSIKLFEYMACEVPVVSTAMPESQRYPGVWIGENSAQFAAHLDQALQAGNDPQYLATIRAVARERSWDKRAEAILNQLQLKAM